MGATHDKIAGKAKEGVGSVTGDRDLESEGKGQHAAGKVKDGIDAVKDRAEDMKDAAKEKAEDVKEQVSGR